MYMVVKKPERRSVVGVKMVNVLSCEHGELGHFSSLWLAYVKPCCHGNLESEIYSTRQGG